jgi:DNA-binding transcriptional LysR family regulator
MISDFDMVDLRLFVNIAETNSVRRGAQRSHLSAPAASARIRNLEDATGSKLLHRTSVGVTLTPPGQAFLHHAKLVLLQLESLGRDLQEYTPSLKGYLRLAANPTATTEYLPNVLPAYIASHADVRLDLQELLSSEIVRAVSGGTADVGIIAGPVRTEDLEVLDYRETRLAVVTSLDHPLASRNRVSFAETLAYEWVVLPGFSPTYEFTHQKGALRHAPASARVQVLNIDALCRMAEAGVGIGIVPEPSAQRHARSIGIRVIPLSDESASFKLRICARQFKALPTYARDLVDMLLAERDAHRQVVPIRRARSRR